MREVLLVCGLGAEHAAHIGYSKGVTELSGRAGHRGGYTGLVARPMNITMNT
jgi:hypothetical protein